jgi:threonine dehydrogenase-like Zn-dependent dehydrogenase
MSAGEWIICTLLAMNLVAPRGRVVVVGVCMTEDRIRPMTGINKHLTLQFVLGYTPDEYKEALESIADGRVDPSPLVTRCVSLDELPTAFHSLSDPKDCKVVLEIP